MSDARGRRLKEPGTPLLWQQYKIEPVQITPNSRWPHDLIKGKYVELAAQKRSNARPNGRRHSSGNSQKESSLDRANCAQEEARGDKLDR